MEDCLPVCLLLVPFQRVSLASGAVFELLIDESSALRCCATGGGVFWGPACLWLARLLAHFC